MRSFMYTFEAEAKAVELPEKFWVTKLTAQLKGRARDLAVIFLQQNMTATFTQL